MNEGRIIEYIEQGKFICTICLQDKGTKLHLLTASSREVNLSPKRAILISDASIDLLASREELLETLKHADAVRTRLTKEVDVQELWELTRDEEQSFDHRYLAQLCFGEAVKDEHLSALLRAVFEDRLYFRLKDGRFRPNTQEQVDQISKQREREAFREERLNKGSSWLKNTLEGKVTEGLSTRADVIKCLTQLALFGNDAPDFRYGKELLLRAGVSDIGKARSILIKLGIWDEDENLDLHRLGIEPGFGELETAESSRMAERGYSVREREDLRGLPIVTIDGPHTRDFDDAISVELNGEFLDVGIHIADVTAWIEPGSILDHAAAQRASSLYLPRQQIPMLPPDLSQDILSLKQGCDRPAISLLARLDKNGNLIDYRFVASLIRVQENLVYDAVNSGLGGRIAFSQIHRLCQKLREKRMERGALSLSLPEIEILVGADCSVSISLVSQDSPSSMIVAELMILYNWLAARFCNEHKIPLLYRTQAEPSERLKHDTDGYFYYVFTQRRKLNPLLIDISPKQHSGLGLEVYTHATSPIRRYLDLVTQRQLGGYLTGVGPVYGTSDLEALRIPIEPMLRDLARVKRNRIRYWVLKYLSQHQNEQFKALMLYELRNKYRILLTDSLIIGDIRKQMHRTLQPADEIMVEVKKADPLENRLELEYRDGSERRND